MCCDREWGYGQFITRKQGFRIFTNLVKEPGIPAAYVKAHLRTISHRLGLKALHYNLHVVATLLSPALFNAQNMTPSVEISASYEH